MRNLIAVAIAAIALASSGVASAYPGSWLRQARCIRHYESRNRWHISDPPYSGAYQFLDSTWLRWAPSRLPRRAAAASPAQQTLVAWRVYVANGRRWGGNQWPNSALACGLR